MKKFFIVLGVSLLALAGCGPRQTAEEKILAALNNMTGYEAAAELTRISNKGTNTYDTKQSFRCEDGAYRLELTSPESVAGNYTVYDGTKICQYNPRVDSKVVMDVPESQPRNELFLGQFINNYNADANATMVIEDLEGTECAKMDTVISGDNKYLAFETLWVSTDNQQPLKLMIFDEDGNERYILLFEEFTYNPEFTEDVFTIPE